MKKLINQLRFYYIFTKFLFVCQNLQAFEGLATCAGKPWSVWDEKSKTTFLYKILVGFAFLNAGLEPSWKKLELKVCLSLKHFLFHLLIEYRPYRMYVCDIPKATTSSTQRSQTSPNFLAYLHRSPSIRQYNRIIIEEESHLKAGQ